MYLYQVSSIHKECIVKKEYIKEYKENVPRKYKSISVSTKSVYIC